MAEFLMEKWQDWLRPVEQDAFEAMHQIPEGAIVKVKVSVPRNIRQHRLFFALVKLLWEHQVEPRQFPTEESLRKAIIMATGHVLEVRDLEGRVHIMPDSISFGRLDNIAFRQFFESALQVITGRILPGVRSRDLEQRVSDMLRLPGPDELERRN